MKRVGVVQEKTNKKGLIIDGVIYYPAKGADNFLNVVDVGDKVEVEYIVENNVWGGKERLFTDIRILGHVSNAPKRYLTPFGYYTPQREIESNTKNNTTAKTEYISKKEQNSNLTSILDLMEEASSLDEMKAYIKVLRMFI